ncbi:MAG: rhodanese-like domain-containing protein [Acidobacteriota bacterium]|nr:rhodanese-like domain-containing protein [Acidobacteriota bacterium]
MVGFLDPEEARRMMAAGAIVVDVRTQEEWDQGHAANSILMPLHELAAHFEQLPRDVPVLLVCRSGARSGQATAYLRNQGLDAHNLGPWQRNPDHQE